MQINTVFQEEKHTPQLHTIDLCLIHTHNSE